MTSQTPKVSVCVATYNHAPFIGQTLDGILAQEVEFPFEIIVGDDASTDGTREIVEAYAAKRPDVIRPLLRAKNIGALRNTLEIFSLLRGEYVALCDGDDRWTSPSKLGTQVQFLASHPDYALCFHDVNIVENGAVVGRYCPEYLEDTPPFSRLFEFNFIPTMSVVYRNHLRGQMPQWWIDMSQRYGIGDWGLHALNAQHGKMRYFRSIWGDYRRHPGGAWSSRSVASNHERAVGMLAELNRLYDYRFDQVARANIRRHRVALATEYDRERRYADWLRNAYSLCQDTAGWYDRWLIAASVSSNFARSKVPGAAREVARAIRRGLGRA